MYLEFAMLQGCYAHGEVMRQSAGLDPYLGQGATANIWFYPHSDNPEMLRNQEQPGASDSAAGNR